MRRHAARRLRCLLQSNSRRHRLTIAHRPLFHRPTALVVETIPTIGFNVESVTFKGVKFNVWDVGGQDKIRALWRHYYEGVQGIIFVVDSNDGARVAEAKKELMALLSAEELRDTVLLVLMNKQDLDGALTPTRLVDEMGLRELTGRNKWYGQPCCAKDGSGLNEGLDWLSHELKSRAASAKR